MNRTETRQRLIDFGIAAERLPIDGQFYLTGADLRWANLREADLSRADLSQADLSRAHLSGAHLRGADLTGASLIWANLTGANLCNATLSGAVLHGANLSGASLSGADLGGANLNRAHLRGADLRGAHLSGASINWQSHDLIAEILRRAAADNVSRRMLSGLILISHDWCWDMFLALDIAPAVRDWALDELRKWVKEGDNAPTVLTTTNMSPDDLRDEADRNA